MNPIEELIQKYEKKKSETERFLNHRYYNKIEWFESWVDEDIKIFSEIIEDLKNLPNELRAVNRNENAEEFCRFGYSKHDRCNNECDSTGCELK